MLHPDPQAGEHLAVGGVCLGARPFRLRESLGPCRENDAHPQARAVEPGGQRFVVNPGRLHQEKGAVRRSNPPAEIPEAGNVVVEVPRSPFPPIAGTDACGEFAFGNIDADAAAK